MLVVVETCVEIEPVGENTIKKKCEQVPGKYGSNMKNISSLEAIHQ